MTSLKELYFQDEKTAEKRLNHIALGFGLFFLMVVALVAVATDVDPLDINYVSNVIGVLFFLTYHVIDFALLRRGIYHPVMKYLTSFFTATTVTIVIVGYSLGTDYVHAFRTASLSAYFLVIALSGLYQNPRLPLFTSGVVILEYLLFLLFAQASGFEIHGGTETFHASLLTYDVLIVLIVCFLGEGVLIHTIALRHRGLVLRLRKSDSELVKERSGRLRIQQKASFLENYDSMTKLPNIHHFKEKLEGVIERAGARGHYFAVMCFGLDSFKNVNQLYGTDAGHEVLKIIANRLSRAFRDDDFVARMQSDRFLVIFSDLKPDYSISDLIRKAGKVVADPIRLGTEEVKITAGAGFSTFPRDDSTVDGLLEKAEMALYDAKKRGKGQYRLFDTAMQTALDKRMRLEKELDGACARGELHLVFQPKVNTNGRVTGMESLLRWNSPVFGAVSPEVFIAAAETSDLIVEIGYFVFEECCRHIKRWEALGIDPIRITVNVSPHQFAQRDLADRVKGILRDHGVDSHWLGVEITESGMREDCGDCIDKLFALKAMGLSISIDDFGKGYSSLNRLGYYPIDTLKIDKAFVDDLPGSQKACSIVKSIIGLGHNLGCTIVAEGVETDEQVDFLSRNGCGYFQGYHFYKPLSAEEISLLLQTRDGVAVQP